MKMKQINRNQNINGDNISKSNLLENDIQKDNKNRIIKINENQKIQINIKNIKKYRRYIENELGGKLLLGELRVDRYELGKNKGKHWLFLSVIPRSIISLISSLTSNIEIRSRFIEGGNVITFFKIIDVGKSIFE